MTVSAALAAVIGPGPLPRGQVMKKFWSISKPIICKSQNKRNIIADQSYYHLWREERSLHVRDDEAGSGHLS